MCGSPTCTSNIGFAAPATAEGPSVAALPLPLLRCWLATDDDGPAIPIPRCPPPSPLSSRGRPSSKSRMRDGPPAPDAVPALETCGDDSDDEEAEASLMGGWGGVSPRPPAEAMSGIVEDGSDDSPLSPSGPSGPRLSSMASRRTTCRPGRRGARRAPALPMAVLVIFGREETTSPSPELPPGAARVAEVVIAAAAVVVVVAGLEAALATLVSSPNPDSSAGRRRADGGWDLFSEGSSPHGEAPSGSRSSEASDGGETPEVIEWVSGGRG